MGVYVYDACKKLKLVTKYLLGGFLITIGW